MERMKTYINNVGKSIVPSIKMAQAKRQKGHAVWLTFYGYYSLRVHWFKKLKLAIQNVRGAKI
jgi:hypothetical protein